MSYRWPVLAMLVGLKVACAAAPAPEPIYYEPQEIQAVGPAAPVAQPIPECHAYFAYAEQAFTGCAQLDASGQLAASLREDRLMLPSIERDGSAEDRVRVGRYCVSTRASLEKTERERCQPQVGSTGQKSSTAKSQTR